MQPLVMQRKSDIEDLAREDLAREDLAREDS
jgi:hypothetical protein